MRIVIRCSFIIRQFLVNHIVMTLFLYVVLYEVINSKNIPTFVVASVRIRYKFTSKQRYTIIISYVLPLVFANYQLILARRIITLIIELPFIDINLENGLEFLETTVLSPTFLSEWVTMTYVMGKRDFTRVGTRMRFRRICCIAQPPWYSKL